MSDPAEQIARLQSAFDAEEDQISATLRDLRAKQDECLPVMARLRHAGRLGDLEAVAELHGGLVAREIELTTKLTEVRSLIEQAAANVSEVHHG